MSKDNGTFAHYKMGGFLMENATAKKTILIVEDEKNIVDILRFNLQREGYDRWRPTTARLGSLWPGP